MWFFLISTIICAFVVFGMYKIYKVYKKYDEALEQEEENVVKTCVIDASHITKQKIKSQHAKTASYHETTFIVWYKDGNRKEETVSSKNPYYDIYMNKIQQDDPQVAKYLKKLSNAKKLYDAGVISADVYEKTKSDLS